VIDLLLVAHDGTVMDGRHADTVTSLPDSTQQPQQTQHISNMARWVPFLETYAGWRGVGDGTIVD
jgi:hypothetical protein